MGLRGTKIRAAISHLRGDGCDLTDPSVNDNIRADDATFYLGYLEELCGFRLTAREVVRIARGMMGEDHLDVLPVDAHHRAARFVGMN
jgi:hypothetical protein